MLIRGAGRALVGDRIVDLATHDLVRVPPLTWHQFRATESEPLHRGRRTIVGTLIGAVIVGIFRNGLTLIGVQVIYQYLVTGILVILAVSVDQLTHRRRL